MIWPERGWHSHSMRRRAGDLEPDLESPHPCTWRKSKLPLPGIHLWLTATLQICSLHVTFVWHFFSSRRILITHLEVLYGSWTQKCKGLLWEPASLQPKPSLWFCTQLACRRESPEHFRYIFLACPHGHPGNQTSLWMHRPAEIHWVLNTAWIASGDLPKLIYSHSLTPGPCLSANKGISSQHL